MLFLWLLAIILLAGKVYAYSYSDQFISGIKSKITEPYIYLVARHSPLTESPREYLKRLAPRSFALLDRIVVCESNYKPLAKNPLSTAAGIFQFISSTWDAWGEGNVFNAYDNIDAGVKLFKAKGTKPWLASVGCWK